MKRHRVVIFDADTEEVLMDSTVTGNDYRVMAFGNCEIYDTKVDTAAGVHTITVTGIDKYLIRGN